MARNTTAPRWIAAGLLSATIAAAGWASFSGSGLRIETGGVELVMKASVDQGLIVKFLNTRQPL
ncbi:MAG: hypothetical protein AAGJ84_08880 [Pseudomonadota bacterium]